MKVELIAVPYDSGVPDVRMGRGPRRLLDGGLADQLRTAGHVVSTREIRPPPPPVPSEVATAVALLTHLSERVGTAVQSGALPVVLAGSCYSAVGTVAGLQGGTGPATEVTSRAGERDLAVFWFDTHADFNTPESTETGFLDGMAVAMLTGRCWTRLLRRIPGFRPVSEHLVTLLGVREIDPPEEELLADSAVGILAPADVGADLCERLEALRMKAEGAYLHVDLDVIDPGEARANALATPNGLSVTDLVTAVEAIRQAVAIRAIALTAYDPAVDPDGRVVDAAQVVLDSLLGGPGST